MPFRDSMISTRFSQHAVAFAIVAMGLSIVIGIVSIFLVSGLNNIPSWWAHSDRVIIGDADAIADAEQFENAISTQLTQPRDPNQPRWAVAVTEQQANDWLAIRCRQTIETHFGHDAWPSELDRLRVGFVDNQLIVGGRLRHASGSLIVWAKLDLLIDDHGELFTKLKHVRVGTTIVPKWIVSKLVRRYEANNQTLRVGSALIDLGDGRRVQLLGVQVNGDQLELALETQLDSE